MNNRFTCDGQRLVHADDYAEDEMTICGIYCGAQVEQESTKDPVDCPECIAGLNYYKSIKTRSK